MFRNYLVVALKVLARRKFFSFVNLFGIAITLAALTAGAAILNTFLSAQDAEASSKNYLSVSDLELTNKEGSYTSNWSLGYRFIEKHIYPLTTPDDIGIFNETGSGTLYVGDRKLRPVVVSTDAGYWRILEHEFLAGAPISEEDVEQGNSVVVLNATMANDIFGSENPLDQRIDLDGRPFRVIGVVADVSETREDAFGEIWMPHSAAPTQAYREQWISGFHALLYAEDPARLDLIREEYLDSLQAFVHEDPERYEIAHSAANTKLEKFVRELTDNRYEAEVNYGLAYGMIAVGVFLFMFIPAINLINLNVSRIMERASEIGVRKAFGASVRTLVGQFLVESLVLSLLGGIAGYLLAWGVLSAIETFGWIPYAQFVIDLKVFVAALLLMGVFGLISGVYPAFKMARMHPVAALKRG